MNTMIRTSRQDPLRKENKWQVPARPGPFKDQGNPPCHHNVASLLNSRSKGSGVVLPLAPHCLLLPPRRHKQIVRDLPRQARWGWKSKRSQKVQLSRRSSRAVSYRLLFRWAKTWCVAMAVSASGMGYLSYSQPREEQEAMFQALSLEDKKRVLESFLTERQSPPDAVHQVAYTALHCTVFSYSAFRFAAFSPFRRF